MECLLRTQEMSPFSLKVRRNHTQNKQDLEAYLKAISKHGGKQELAEI